VTITPGPVTAMVVRSAAAGGPRHALVCTAVATSVTVSTAVKLA
jgi:threonine/homoserine/homoserine lactone efflux protein